MTTTAIVCVAATLLTGLVAGLFYGYDCSVIQGLGKLPDREYIATFQSINREILNPYFFLSFMGSAIVLPIACWLTYRAGGGVGFYFMLTATLLYYVGVIGITGGGNIPLNDAIDRFDLAQASEDAIGSMRRKFEAEWNLFHHLRTWASIACFLCAILALIKKSW